MIEKIKNFFTSKESKTDFQLGYETGYEEGQRDAYADKFENTDALSITEQIEVNEFLRKRNLTICFDSMRGGLRIRKEKR